MKIKKNETKIIGHWIFDGFKMIADDQCRRIDWLISNLLKQISTDETGWIKLFQDPEDKRYWELRFEKGEMQGGGPSILILLSEKEAKKKYNI
jgi:hypothetical protein